MVKIALDAGHGINTPGKRSPADEREWSFNNKVLLAAIERLNMYYNVQILRLDDPTGRTDIPLRTRTNKANSWNADVLVSIHHNALAGRWHSGGGVETFTQPGSSRASEQIADIINPRIVSAMGLRNRGTKKMNLHMTRESKMPAILTEGGFMDSTVDILALRDVNKLKAQGYAIADGLAQYFKLKLKNDTSVSSSQNSPTILVLQYGDSGEAVRLYQEKLKEIGYIIVADSSFGPAMRTIVQQFQRDNGLEVDGILGPITQRKIDEAIASKKGDLTMSQYKELKDEIEKLKQRLGTDREVSSGFADDWKWAQDKGLLDGTRPSHPVTREQLAAILHRYDSGNSLSHTAKGDLREFLEWLFEEGHFTVNHSEKVNDMTEHQIIGLLTSAMNRIHNSKK